MKKTTLRIIHTCLWILTAFLFKDVTDSGQKFSVFFDPYLFIYTIGHDIYLTELQGRINGTSSHSSQQSGTVGAGETRSSAPLAQQTQSSQAEESQAEDSFTAGSAASQLWKVRRMFASFLVIICYVIMIPFIQRKPWQI